MNTDLKTLLFTYSGRINRGKFWLATAIYFAIMIVVIAVGFIMVGNSLLIAADEEAADIAAGVISKGIGYVLILLVIYVPMVISGVMVGIKRLHDRDKSGWWLLVFYLLPAVLGWLSDSISGGVILSLASLAVSIWGLVELGFLRGTAGANRFGPDPLSA
jgi:uncharacterized membrane protein YhaH (DUF805 family)